MYELRTFQLYLFLDLLIEGPSLSTNNLKKWSVPRNWNKYKRTLPNMKDGKHLYMEHMYISNMEKLFLKTFFQNLHLRYLTGLSIRLWSSQGILDMKWSLKSIISFSELKSKIALSIKFHQKYKTLSFSHISVPFMTNQCPWNLLIRKTSKNTSTVVNSAPKLQIQLSFIKSMYF